MDEKIIIERAKTPFIIRLTLTVILFICFLVPLLTSFFFLESGKGPHIGIAISFLIFWGIGFLMLRIVLWNAYGREIVTLETDKITYIADYKYFKDAHQAIEIKGMVVEAILDESEKNLGRIRFFNEDITIETVLESTNEERNAIIEKISRRYAIDH